eukprot:UN09182
MRGLDYCPQCGKGKRFDCQCEYGKIMKMKMEPSDRQKDFFRKKYCPKCASTSSSLKCKNCGFLFQKKIFGM